MKGSTLRAEEPPLPPGLLVSELRTGLNAYIYAKTGTSALIYGLLAVARYETRKRHNRELFLFPRKQNGHPTGYNDTVLIAYISPKTRSSALS